MSAGVALPKKVFGHGFVNNRGVKMSKSLGNVVNPFTLAEEFGVDQLRYFLLREVPFGQDGNYSSEAITTRINADLANDLGNLAQRSLSMIAKHCDGKLPPATGFSKEDERILLAADTLGSLVDEAMDAYAPHRALEAIWSVVADANRYFAGEEPWAKRKTDFERMESILYTTAEVLRQVAILAQPVIPVAAAKLLDQLAVPQDERDFAALGEPGRLTAGVSLPTPEGIFPRYEMPSQAE
jgi:methionyl-tRNA synthetase